MKIDKLLLLVSLLCLAGSCRNETPHLYNPNNEERLDTPSQIFEAFWNGMNNSYAFWDIDPTDWDKVYDQYMPRFKALDSIKEVETSELDVMYQDICSNLIDHHLSISIVNKHTKAGRQDTLTIIPARNEISKRSYYRTDRMHHQLLIPSILANKGGGRIESLKGGATATQSGMCAYSYNIDNGVAYIYISKFSIDDVYQEGLNDDSVIRAVDNFIEMILQLPNLKGVIVDVRNNTGGLLLDLNHILAPMLGEKLHWAYTRNKNGMGRYDYEPWIPNFIYPAAQRRKVEVPIVAITDLYSVSMAEMIAIAIKALPNGYVVGERSYGGLGPLMEFDISFSGRFKNAAMNVYTSTSMLKTINDEILEGKGVTPDVEVLYDAESMASGVDKQLERALLLIKEKTN